MPLRSALRSIPKRYPAAFQPLGAAEEEEDVWTGFIGNSLTGNKGNKRAWAWRSRFMPWKCTVPLLERRSYVAHQLDGTFSMSELFRRFEISRKCGYGWVRRWEAEGVAGLVDRIRASLTYTHRFVAAMAVTLVALRQ